MITAQQAKANAINYEVNVYRDTEAKVDELLETMSKSIEFHSKSGFDCIEFTPYAKSRFTSIRTMELASEIFERKFKDFGYEIILNSWENNSLKIQW